MEVTRLKQYVEILKMGTSPKDSFNHWMEYAHFNGKITTNNTETAVIIDYEMPELSGRFAKVDILKKYLSLIKKGEADLKPSESNPSGLMLDIDGRKVSIESIPVDTKIINPDLTGFESSISLPFKCFLQLTNMLYWAASNYSSGNVLSCVHFKVDGDKLQAAATNGSVLSWVTYDGPWDRHFKADADRVSEFLVPAELLRNIINKMWTFEADEIEIMFPDDRHRNEILLRIGNVSILAKTAEGQYPQYKQLVPLKADRPIDITFSRKQLIELLEKLSVFVNKKTYCVKVEVLEQSVRWYVDNYNDQAQVETVAEFDFACNVVRCPGVVKTAFNINFLIKGLKKMTGDNVGLYSHGELNPWVFVGEGNHRYLVMPIQVK